MPSFKPSFIFSSRYLPSRKDPITYYVRAGVIVDNDHSNARQVKLTQLTQQSTGRYRCEVSTEAPSFATVSSYGDMQVVGKLYWPLSFLASSLPDRLHTY